MLKMFVKPFVIEYCYCQGDARCCKMKIAAGGGIRRSFMRVGGWVASDSDAQPSLEKARWFGGQGLGLRFDDGHAGLDDREELAR